MKKDTIYKPRYHTPRTRRRIRRHILHRVPLPLTWTRTLCAYNRATRPVTTRWWPVWHVNDTSFVIFYRAIRADHWCWRRRDGGIWSASCRRATRAHSADSPASITGCRWRSTGFPTSSIRRNRSRGVTWRRTSARSGFPIPQLFIRYVMTYLYIICTRACVFVYFISYCFNIIILFYSYI